ncbi:hypothetical protein FMJ19_07335 [Klebsiella michiganensis]|uniref:hypothetical protein n=1 Tax=Klebsiella michiganensis TaxID=1134687 RepID=UPI001CC9BE6D|nr:hypothetical protein [Klebsiella michiganensis]MBZ7348163.1 hypothetical protein [Klebsiella michiganensis]
MTNLFKHLPRIFTGWRLTPYPACQYQSHNLPRNFFGLVQAKHRWVIPADLFFIRNGTPGSASFINQIIFPPSANIHLPLGLFQSRSRYARKT